MSGYRKVNYYELCRLCTSSEGNKMNIFRDEGRRRQLQTKIQTCLPIQVLEEDSLPKIVCHECVRKLENFIEFRETVVSAEGMLESYFTSLRYSEDFLKEGKVYVKNIQKERSSTPDAEGLKSEEKILANTGNQVLTDEQHGQHQQPVVVSNINASNIQIISGVQARVQQYKCAMQMQSNGDMSTAVVEATAEAHYSCQQQTSQRVSPQRSNETQNEISEQATQSPQIQTTNQIQNHNQVVQQGQSQRQISQQLTQSTQITQQNQTQLNHQQQGQSQITQQIHHLQRHHRLQQIDKQQVQIATSQEFIVKQEPSPQVQQNNNILLKPDTEVEQNQQIIQKVTDIQKEDNASPCQNYTTVQAAPEVFLSLGFKETSLPNQSVQDEGKDFKDFTKNEDVMSRTSIGQISEFLRIRSGTEQTPLITVNPQAISQSTRSSLCRNCGKNFASVNLLNSHTCTMMSEGSDSIVKEETLQVNGNSFNCDICAKPFKRKEHLFQHRKLHTGERPYVCTTCAKAFSRKEHLVRHSVSHTGEKMHECELCGKSFSRKDNLHKHRKTHGVAGPYICETCGKSFMVKHYYAMHLTMHAPNITDGSCQDPLPYKCDMCHKAFSVKQYLTAHKYRHRKNNNNSAQNTLNRHQQQQSQQSNNTVNSINVVGNNVAASGNINDNNGQSSNGPTVEIQNVVERSEQTNGSFNNSQYHNNIPEFQ
ncbi:PREDICTED: zinc finger and SCAN domain-containing protein 12-like [Polistes dominula]|uniref:Zinc finger and SCAN domain-containing protein 12-like n=1 Tax=Polistes dominula TaxID=743375 RepID=A0ABM1J897_POLDO|nr:PREDICTED: zinc finger and SCAN domain-containing protein 12-like [Polistes dominula]